MMRNHFDLSRFFHFLDGVIKEEIYQDGIDACVWVFIFNLPSNELNGMDGAAWSV